MQTTDEQTSIIELAMAMDKARARVQLYERVGGMPKSFSLAYTELQSAVKAFGAKACDMRIAAFETAIKDDGGYPTTEGKV